MSEKLCRGRESLSECESHTRMNRDLIHDVDHGEDFLGVKARIPCSHVE